MPESLDEAALMKLRLASPIERKALSEAEQKAFDAAFLEKHPPLEGLDAKGSIEDDGLIIVFSGEKRVMIKRYLLRKYGITFADYKRIYKLGDDYPCVAPCFHTGNQPDAPQLTFGVKPNSAAGKSRRGSAATKVIRLFN